MSHTAPAIKYAAYAASLGYRILFARNADPSVDAPTKFILKDIEVFQTERGWRVARRQPNGVYYPPEDNEYFFSVKKALATGALWVGPMSEGDNNPLLPHLRAVLRQIQGGERSNGKNPYSDPVIKEALIAIAKETGRAEDQWMHVNDA